MSEAPDNTPGYGMAIGAATVAAGVVGTLVSSLFSGKASRRDRAQKQVDERLRMLEAHTSHAVDQLVKVVDGLEFPAAGDSRRARRKATEIGKAAGRLADRTAAAAADLDREAVRLHSLEKANQLGHDGSKRAREMATLLNARASELMSGNRTNLPEWKMRASRSASDAIGKGTALVHGAIESAPDVKDRAPDVVDNVSTYLENVAHRGVKVAGQVREGAPAVGDKAMKSAHEALEQAQHRVPEVREWAHDIAAEASERAHHLAHQVKVHAPELGAQVTTALHDAQHSAKPALNDVSAFAARLVDSAKEAGSHASESLVPEVHHRVDEVAEKAKTQGQASATTLAALGTVAGDKLSHTSEVIEHQSRTVATSAGHGTKDLGALVVWTLAAAGIVYYAFLDEEQRAKARESGKRIVAEAQEVYRDIRGYDEEFT